MAASEGGFEYVFDQTVRSSAVDRYYELSDRLRELAKVQPGFMSLERELVTQEKDVWTFRTKLRFETAAHCMTWLDHPERRHLLDLEEREAGFAFEGRGNWEGYSQWLSRSVSAEPAKWKVNLLVLLTLYPTAMVVTLILNRFFHEWPLALSMLISNILCVAAISWLLVPAVSRIYVRWLTGTSSGGFEAASSLSILLLFGLMFWGFLQVK